MFLQLSLVAHTFFLSFAHVCADSAPQTSTDPSLLYFHGNSCFYCRKVEPSIAVLESELKKPITKLEVYEDRANQGRALLFAAFVVFHVFVVFVVTGF